MIETRQQNTVERSHTNPGLTIELPWPPTANHYWRQVQGRMIISRKGRNYRTKIMAILAGLQLEPMDGPLMVEIEIYPPDRRRRDIDNVPKALLDALQYGGAYLDDSQIVILYLRRHDRVIEGKVHLRIQSCPAIMPHGVQLRTCLRCDSKFLSNGPANRICLPCHDADDQLPIREAALQAQRGVRRHNGEIM